MDDTDLRAAMLKVEAENRRLWTAIDELMRDQTKSDKKTEKLEKRVDVIEAWLAAEAEAEAAGRRERGMSNQPLTKEGHI